MQGRTCLLLCFHHPYYLWFLRPLPGPDCIALAQGHATSQSYSCLPPARLPARPPACLPSCFVHPAHTRNPPRLAIAILASLASHASHASRALFHLPCQSALASFARVAFARGRHLLDTRGPSTVIGMACVCLRDMWDRQTHRPKQPDSTTRQHKEGGEGLSSLSPTTRRERE